MIRSIWIVVLVSFPLFLFAEESKESPIKKDRELLQGTWRATEVIFNGNALPKEQSEKITVENGAGGTWILRSEDRILSKGTNQFDPTKKPKWIDFTIEDGDNKNQTHLGIYELGEKTRRLCFAAAGKDRPKEFASPPQSEVILVTFERVK